ncbi:MAG: Smr/MutS family protein [Desulfobacterales bacterium]|jgi:DNA-nicking Smr family endonuclease
MKTSKSSGAFRPFKELKELLEKKSLKSAPSPVGHAEKQVLKTCDSQHDLSKPAENILDKQPSENELFLKEMADVTPIPREDRIEYRSNSGPPAGPDHDSEDETLLKLDNLVKFGTGFVVADTPEYIEGRGYNVHPEITKRLHRGDFSIQAHIDLHGLGVEDARNAFELFLTDSITTGKKAVLIVHGRGLSSPDKPVLKTRVIQWLTCGPWRKWVIAFSSARSCDGGTGATYALLRQRPLTKRYRKGIKSHRTLKNHC